MSDATVSATAAARCGSSLVGTRTSSSSRSVQLAASPSCSTSSAKGDTEPPLMAGLVPSTVTHTLPAHPCGHPLLFEGTRCMSGPAPAGSSRPKAMSGKASGTAGRGHSCSSQRPKVRRLPRLASFPSASAHNMHAPLGHPLSLRLDEPSAHGAMRLRRQPDDNRGLRR